MAGPWLGLWVEPLPGRANPATGLALITFDVTLTGHLLKSDRYALHFPLEFNLSIKLSCKFVNIMTGCVIGQLGPLVINHDLRGVSDVTV